MDTGFPTSQKTFYMPGKGKMQVFCKIPFSDVGMQNRNFSCGSSLVAVFFHICFRAVTGRVTETNLHRREIIRICKEPQSSVREQEEFFVGEKNNKFAQVI